MIAAARRPSELSILLRGETPAIRSWLAHWSAARLLANILIIVAGTAAFGAAVGSWRAPLQGVYTAIKFPVIILLTTLGNGLLNGMLAPLLGVNITFRQSLLAIFISFTIASAVLGAFSPLIFFLLWNSPPIGAETSRAPYAMLLLVLVTALAFAGISGNLRLFRLLRELAGNRPAALRTLAVWLAGNLLLGSQLSWILRPFVGAPELPLEFLRKNAFEGNFFESLYHTVKNLLL